MDSNAALLNGTVLWKHGRVRTICLIVASLISALIGLGALLVWRRAVGAVGGALPVGMLLQAWLVVGAIALGGRLVWFGEALSRPPRPIFGERPDGEGRDEVFEAIVTWGGSLGIALWAIGCSFGGRWGDWVLWVGLMAADQGELWWLKRSPYSALPSPNGMERSGIRPLAPPFEGGGCEVQRLVRVREAGRTEIVRGTLRAEFAKGQRHVVLHVGFCPPLEGAPLVEARVEDLAGAKSQTSEAEVRVVQAFCHGARLEVRLGEAAREAYAVMVSVSAKPRAAAE